jgi:hypothetical protein
MNKYSVLSLGVALLLAMSSAAAGEPEVKAPKSGASCCAAQQDGRDYDGHDHDTMDRGHCEDRVTAPEREAEAQGQEHEVTDTGIQRKTRASNVSRKHHHRR